MDKGADSFKVMVSFGQKYDSHDFNAAGKLTALLYDPKKKYDTHHHSLNNLRSKIVTIKDVALTQLRPSEANFWKHIKRRTLRDSGNIKVWQTKVQCSSHIGMAHLGSLKIMDRKEKVTPLHQFSFKWLTSIPSWLTVTGDGLWLQTKTKSNKNMPCCSICPCNAGGEHATIIAIVSQLLNYT